MRQKRALNRDYVNRTLVKDLTKTSEQAKVKLRSSAFSAKMDPLL